MFPSDVPTFLLAVLVTRLGHDTHSNGSLLIILSFILCVEILIYGLILFTSFHIVRCSRSSL
jgi:hypothetical protein